MKSSLPRTFPIFLVAGSLAVAESEPDVLASLISPDAVSWLTPTVNVRLRYEFGDLDSPGLDEAHALTIRERLGLRLGAFSGFTAFAEYEGTQHLVDDFSTPPTTSPGPGPGSETVIADPRSNELNRAWLQWEGFESEVKVGRQRLILDNAAFVGNIGWRQNEQTFDAAVVRTEWFENFGLLYAYVDRVNRIFGSEADGALSHFEGDTHLFHAGWDGSNGIGVTGYVYLMDFHERGAADWLWEQNCENTVRIQGWPCGRL